MRPIDGDALEEIVRDGLKEVPHNDGLARRHHKAEHIHFLDLIRRAPTIAPPPNDPMTLEELREMDGEPVWTITIGIEGSGRWELCTCEVVSACPLHKVLRCVTSSGEVTDYEFENYGKTWTAYRRRPENQKDFGGET